VPWWGVVSSAVAPVLLVAGWTLLVGSSPAPSMPSVALSAAWLVRSAPPEYCSACLPGSAQITGAGQVGLAERVLGVAQASWPLAVVLSCCLSQTSCPDVTRGPRWHWPAVLSLNFRRIH